MYVLSASVLYACDDQYSSHPHWEQPILIYSATLDRIDKHTLEIAQVDDQIYTDLLDLADELPDHSPRYVLLSYPLTLVRNSSISNRLHALWLTAVQPSGRLSVPYVLLYYLPVTCNAELRMLYAGAKELMRNTAEVGRVIEMVESEELESIEEKLRGEK